MTTSVFKKSVVVNYNTTSFPADTIHTLVRTFNNSVIDSAGNPDASQILVYFNGQQIGTTTTSKYFYSISFTGSPTTSFTITLSANTSYTSPGYVSETPYAVVIGPNDLFFIDYTYTITS